MLLSLSPALIETTQIETRERVVRLESRLDALAQPLERQIANKADLAALESRPALALACIAFAAARLAP